MMGSVTIVAGESINRDRSLVSADNVFGKPTNFNSPHCRHAKAHVKQLSTMVAAAKIREANTVICVFAHVITPSSTPRTRTR